MTELFSAKELAGIREIGEMGMVTPITIERRAESAPPVGGDYGDDFISYTTTSESRRTPVKAWIFSVPTPEQEVDTGMIVTTNTYRMYVPIGTDILPGDLVHTAEGDYTVSDTNKESTWLAMLACSLRKRE